MMLSTTTKGKAIFKVIAVLFLWLLFWEIAAIIFNNEILLPSPIATAKTLLSLMQTGEFYLAVILSLLRIIGGYGLGIIIGISGGVLSYHSKLFNALFSPIIKIVRAVPVASFIILAFVWFKSDILPVFICFLMVMPMIWNSVQSGLENIDIKYLELAQVYSLGYFKTLVNIKLPIIIPSVISTAFTALGFAWKSGIAAEVICKPVSSIGGMLRDAQVYIEMSEVFAVTAVVALLSILLESTIKRFIKEKKNDKA